METLYEIKPPLKNMNMKNQFGGKARFGKFHVKPLNSRIQDQFWSQFSWEIQNIFLWFSWVFIKSIIKTTEAPFCLDLQNEIKSHASYFSGHKCRSNFDCTTWKYPMYELSILINTKRMNKLSKWAYLGVGAFLQNVDFACIGLLICWLFLGFLTIHSWY